MMETPHIKALRSSYDDALILVTSYIPYFESKKSRLFLAKAPITCN